MKAEVKGKVIMSLRDVNMGVIMIDEKNISVMTRSCGFIVENKKRLPNVRADLSGVSPCLTLNNGIYSFKDDDGMKELNEDVSRVSWWENQLDKLFQRFGFAETEIFEHELDFSLVKKFLTPKQLKSNLKIQSVIRNGNADLCLFYFECDFGKGFVSKK